ncbi:MAG TPA: hypothetical protein VFS10_22495 [Pyrinomonadaceae bacterium]|nr:hypothetical protein [Pyrinomonadaceae bacterium]
MSRDLQHTSNVILSGDIFRIDPTEIEKARVRLTIMDGRVIYEAGVADKR